MEQMISGSEKSRKGGPRMCRIAAPGSIAGSSPQGDPESFGGARSASDYETPKSDSNTGANRAPAPARVPPKPKKSLGKLDHLRKNNVAPKNTPQFSPYLKAAYSADADEREEFLPKMSESSSVSLINPLL